MTTRTIAGVFVAALVGVLTVPVAGNKNFIADWTFTGSSLAGWPVFGRADWRAENGEIVGTPLSAEGGWLMLDRPHQDLQLAATFRCTGGCRAGVLLRAEKTATGWKGVYVALVGEPSASYAVTIDNAGRELSRTPLEPAGGGVRFIAPAAGRGGAATPTAASTGRAAGPPAPPALPDRAPYTRPVHDYRPNEWNTLEILIDANILRVWVNDGPEAGVANGRADDVIGRYGPIGFFVGGSGEVRYRMIETKDLGRRVVADERVGPRFRAQRLSDFYYGWSAAAADVNRDGHLDVVAGPFYFLGPDYRESREIYLSQTANPSTQYTPAMLNFAHDYTGDGWPDVLVTEGRAFVMYVNPGTERRRWDRHPAFANGSEAVAFADVNGDGRPDPVILNGGAVAWATPDVQEPTRPWTVHPVSGPGFGTPAQHGIGAGDINGDGRMDIVHPYGWWEQPAGGATTSPWTFHPVALGRWPRVGASPGGGEMVVFDVNGDGRNDVVTSLEAHAWGLSWFEQRRDNAGGITFVEHRTMDDFTTKNAGGVTFSQPHALSAADVDGDGRQDIIVGKRAFAHSESYLDPDPYGEPVLYWYRAVRNPAAPGGAEFVPELIHNRSGAGSRIGSADLNADGAVDVLTSTIRGTFIFWGTKP
jgi:hypothetical protein